MSGADTPFSPGRSLAELGYVRVDGAVPAARRERLRAVGFAPGKAGQRCLLDVGEVREVAVSLRDRLTDLGVLASGAVAVQAIAFDKSPAANWRVSWHQDLMFPVADLAVSAEFECACRKDGVPYARPPVPVLEQLLAVRLHLDPCGAGNGPLRVSPGSHRQGVIASEQLAEVVRRHGEVTATADEGEVLLMRPLLVHASSPAEMPHHRRVLHLVYHEGSLPGAPWHRAV